jgi:hypothetical protein
MSDDKRERTKHPSFGNITVTRCSGKSYLFGSDVEHYHCVNVQVCGATLERSLSHDWIFSDERIVDFYMTEAQWAHFVSSFGDGSGTPITIRGIGNKMMPETPKPPKETSKFRTEMAERVMIARDALVEAQSQLDEALTPGGKPLGKKALEQLRSKLHCAQLNIKENIKYVEDQFSEAMEERMSKAKIEFDAWVSQRLQRMGLEKALEDRTENPRGLPDKV